MKVIYGLYPDPDSAQRAFNFLSAAATELAFDTRDIAVLSSEPFEEFEFVRREAKTAMPWLAAFGGLLGGFSGFLLASWTQQAYPIPTGGMPIVTLWSDGIITYELTMLGAIVFTLLTLLATARLPGWGNKLYDPEVSTGKILVGVVNPPEDLRVELERRLREAGANQVKEFASQPHDPNG